jgi:DNA-binding transcriptional LysR family regulator
VDTREAGIVAAVDLRPLSAFAAVAEERHCGRAADRLGVAQPALSQAIRALEDELGLRLLSRPTSPRVSLTVAGEELLPHARATLAAAEAR